MTVISPPEKVVLPKTQFVSQTFNNCGPASLSMIMSMQGKTISQSDLASVLRPFNNPEGGVDDKSVFASEMVAVAKENGFESMQRPNGTIDLIKKFTANGISVLVRTWLNPNEDIGHFRVVRGYDDTTRTILQDDSYQGPDLTYSYDEFLTMWQPFNYGYILVYPPEKQKVVEAILADEFQEQKAWQNALMRAEKELKDNPDDSYAKFNVATAHFYLGDYGKTVVYYEVARNSLPSRMLWYQYEPLEAYLKLKRYSEVFSLTDAILANGNQAYSEMYLLRGQAYLEQGRVDDATAEFEKAVYYNSGLKKAQDALASVQ